MRDIQTDEMNTQFLQVPEDRHKKNVRTEKPKSKVTDNGELQQDSPALAAVSSTAWGMAKAFLNKSLTHLEDFNQTLLDQAKIYIPNPQLAPPGVQPEQGPKGGWFYESTAKPAQMPSEEPHYISSAAEKISEWYRDSNTELTSDGLIASMSDGELNALSELSVEDWQDWVQAVQNHYSSSAPTGINPEAGKLWFNRTQKELAKRGMGGEPLPAEEGDIYQKTLSEIKGYWISPEPLSEKGDLAAFLHTMTDEQIDYLSEMIDEPTLGIGISKIHHEHTYQEYKPNPALDDVFGKLVQGMAKKEQANRLAFVDAEAKLVNSVSWSGESGLDGLSPEDAQGLLTDEDRLGKKLDSLRAKGVLSPEANNATLISKLKAKAAVQPSKVAADLHDMYKQNMSLASHTRESLYWKHMDTLTDEELEEFINYVDNDSGAYAAKLGYSGSSEASTMVNSAKKVKAMREWKPEISEDKLADLHMASKNLAEKLFSEDPFQAYGSFLRVTVEDLSDDELNLLENNPNSLMQAALPYFGTMTENSGKTALQIWHDSYATQVNDVLRATKNKRIAAAVTEFAEAFPAAGQLKSLLISSNSDTASKKVDIFLQELTDEELEEFSKNTIGVGNVFHMAQGLAFGKKDLEKEVQKFHDKVNDLLEKRNSPEYKDSLLRASAFVGDLLNSDSDFSHANLTTAMSEFSTEDLQRFKNASSLKTLTDDAGVAASTDPSAIRNSLRKAALAVIFGREKGSYGTKVTPEELGFLNPQERQPTQGEQRWSRLMEMSPMDRLRDLAKDSYGSGWSDARRMDFLWTLEDSDIEEIQQGLRDAAGKFETPSSEEKRLAIDTLTSIGVTDINFVGQRLNPNQLNYLSEMDGFLEGLILDSDSFQGYSDDEREEAKQYIKDSLKEEAYKRLGKDVTTQTMQSWLNEHLKLRQSEWSSSTSRLQAILSSFGKFDVGAYESGPTFKANIMNAIGKQMDERFGYFQATPEVMSELVSDLNSYYAIMGQDHKQITYNPSYNSFSRPHGGGGLTVWDVVDEVDQNKENIGRPDLSFAGMEEYRMIRMHSKENTFGHTIGEQLISRYVQSWASSSSDSYPLSVAVQKIVAEKFGLEDFTAKYSTSDALSQAKDITDVCRNSLEAFVDLTYEHTQNLLEAAGIEDAYLSRGMRWDTEEEMPDGVAEALNGRKKAQEPLPWRQRADALSEGFQALQDDILTGDTEKVKYLSDNLSLTDLRAASMSGMFGGYAKGAMREVAKKEISSVVGELLEYVGDSNYWGRGSGEWSKKLTYEQGLALSALTTTEILEVGGITDEAENYWSLRDNIENFNYSFGSVTDKINQYDGDWQEAGSLLKSTFKDFVDAGGGNFIEDFLKPSFRSVAGASAAKYISWLEEDAWSEFSGVPKSLAKAYYSSIKSAAKEFLKEKSIKEHDTGGGRKSALFEQELPLNPVSSFSTSYDTAKGFSSSQEYGLVMVSKVPREKIFSCFRTGLGCANEKEVVCLGGLGSTRAEVWKGSSEHHSLIGLEEAFQRREEAPDAGMEDLIDLPEGIDVPVTMPKLPHPVTMEALKKVSDSGYGMNDYGMKMWMLDLDSSGDPTGILDELANNPDLLAEISEEMSGEVITPWVTNWGDISKKLVEKKAENKDIPDAAPVSVATAQAMADKYSGLTPLSENEYGYSNTLSQPKKIKISSNNGLASEYNMDKVEQDNMNADLDQALYEKNPKDYLGNKLLDKYGFSAGSDYQDLIQGGLTPEAAYKEVYINHYQPFE